MKRVLTITLLVALLVALTANVAAAHKGGPKHGNTYSKNFYPPEYFRYCEPDGADYFTGDSLSDRCDKGYSEYRTKWANGKKYYYGKTFFEWVSPVLTHTGASKSGTAQRSYYCALHKYDDPDSKYARLRCQLTDEPSGKRYWEGFDRGKLDPPPNTTITQGPGNHVRDAPAEYRFESSEAGSEFECRHRETPTWNEPEAPWHSCSSPYSYQPSNRYYQYFEVRAIDKVGNVDPTPARDYYNIINGD